MWGGFEFQPEGSIFSLVILFFAILTGLNFRNQQESSIQSANLKSGLTQQDRELVMSALNKSHSQSPSNDEPKVIVVKQEISEPVNKDSDEKKSIDDSVQPPAHDPYGMSQNPYFTYPPDYYYEEDEEDEYEDEWEDEEDEWEDEEDE